MGIFNWFKSKSVPEQPPIQEPKKPEYVHLHINLAGTTFKTDGVSRQTLIRKIKQGKPPFENQGALQIGLNETTYNDEPAIACKVNDILIGWIPKNKIEDVFYAMDQKGCTVSAFDVVGGNMVNGERLSYGVKIVVRYEKE